MSHVKSDPPTSHRHPSSHVASTELKLYQAFVFSVPIFFTFVLLFLFYLFYLRPRRADWASLRMRRSLQHNNHDISGAELGLRKELREMLPIIVYKETFSITDSQCSVCLGEYQADDRLQQIPACGHTFHMECIDHWLSNHTTCPLCRLSLLASAKATSESPDIQVQIGHEVYASENGVETSDRLGNGTEEEERRSMHADQGRDSGDARNEPEEQENSRDSL
ncbi:putative RING/U-box superfamily protein [Tripterygium wilfordii]|uniref:RING-type E3 ubiquitin transferase n=1 Tax=Tripterygium wilfordii TaxID=458696 RepID=A0A7J7CY62_TRIWF|nr:RING-H2 finger protein ATL7-like [Tripterygium wilfordii]KAF5738816.1 putative RING/U-box superfamily protein [Tripterygium wilfordii]